MSHKKKNRTQFGNYVQNTQKKKKRTKIPIKSPKLTHKAYLLS